MAETKKQMGERREKVGGREVIYHANGDVTWADTGETTDAAAVAEYGILFAGEGADKAKHEVINASIVYWVKTYAKNEEEFKNTIRGFVLGFFEPPASFNNENEETGEVRERLACWVKLTLPCYVKNQNKEIVLAQVGQIVWVDITHANTAIVRAARPKSGGDDSAPPVGVVEVQCEPVRKVTFNDAGHTAWRMRVSGGWRQATDDLASKRKGGFRTLGPEEIAKLAHRMVPPEILDVEAAAQLAGVKGPRLDPGARGPALAPTVTHNALPAHEAN